MTARTPVPKMAPGGVEMPTAIDDWLELQGDLIGLSLAQIAQWHQAAWTPWIDFATAWWRLPSEGGLLGAGLPFWVRGTEQLA